MIEGKFAGMCGKGDLRVCCALVPSEEEEEFETAHFELVRMIVQFIGGMNYETVLEVLSLQLILVNKL